MRLIHGLCSLSLIIALSACGDDVATDTTQGGDTSAQTTEGEGSGETTEGEGSGETTEGEGLELIGQWDDNYGGTSEVSEGAWGADTIVSYSNADNWAIIQTSAEAAWNPGTFSKVVWTEPTDGAFFVCTVDYALESLEEAEGSEMSADDADPLAGGCGDFPWTEMRAPLEIKGDWHTSYDENVTLTTFVWRSTETLIRHHNEDNWAISRVADDAEWNPGTFSKHVWTEVEEGTFWLCTVGFGFESVEEAIADTTEADATNPAESGCGAFGWTQYMPIVEVTGTWHSNHGGEWTVQSALWGIDVVHAYDNDDNWAVVQLPESDEWNPSAFAKHVWTEPEADGSFYLCTIAFGLETLEAAIAAEDTSDASDPANGGCADFPWTHYKAILEVGGSYTNQFEGTETIDSDAWNTAAVVSYDNTLNHAVLYTPEDAEWGANTYSKVVWLEPSWDGSVYYCTVAFDLESEEEALAAEDISDASDPETGGCGDFAWTKLTPSN